MVNYFEEIQKQFGNAGATAALRVMKLCADARAGRFDKRKYIALAQQCARNFEPEELFATLYIELLECQARGEQPVGDTIFTRIFTPRETLINAISVSIDEEDETGYSLADRLAAGAIVEFEDPVERAQEEQNMFDWHDSADLRREIVQYAISKNLGARQTIEQAMRVVVDAGWESIRRHAVRKRIHFDAEKPSAYACDRGVTISRIAVEKLLKRAPRIRAAIQELSALRPDRDHQLRAGLISVLAPLCRSAGALRMLFDLTFEQLVFVLRIAGQEIRRALENGLVKIGKRGRGQIFKITKQFIQNFAANFSATKSRANSVTRFIEFLREVCLKKASDARNSVRGTKQLSLKLVA